MEAKKYVDSAIESGRNDLNILCQHLWISYFKYPIDSMSLYWDNRYGEIRKYFFECPWHKVYSFIEFVANNFPAESPNEKINDDFMNYSNLILEVEMSAYRFVGGIITQITSPEEISTVEEALKTDFFKPVNQHLETALKYLSDRKSPDYRNSIKESISAVEAICRYITNSPNVSLNDALVKIKKQDKIKIHPALEDAFKKLYGYTSDEKGIRHSLFELPDVEFEEAKFMLVSCSAFINYLISKSSKRKK